MLAIHDAARDGMTELTLWVFGKEWQANRRRRGSDGWSVRTGPTPIEAIQNLFECEPEPSVFASALGAAVDAGMTGFALSRMRENGWRATTYLSDNRSVRRIAHGPNPVLTAIEALTKRVGITIGRPEQPTDFASVGLAASLRLLAHEMHKNIEARR